MTDFSNKLPPESQLTEQSFTQMLDMLRTFPTQVFGVPRMVTWKANDILTLLRRRGYDVKYDVVKGFWIEYIKTWVDMRKAMELAGIPNTEHSAEVADRV